jgi:hypothetical protein
MLLNFLRLIKQEFKNRKKLTYCNTSDLNLEEIKIINELNENGFCLVENFYDKEKCDNLKLEIDLLLIAHPPKLWKDEDDADYRAWGTEKKSDLIHDFYQNKLISRLVKAHESHSEDIKSTTMLGRIRSEVKNDGSGGGWHRDLPHFKQTKVILYLSDVDEKNGPFQYLKGSHKSFDVIKSQLKYKLDLNQNRFTDEVINDMIASSTGKLLTANAKAGTLLIANTRGIHRGQPFENGERYALTNYYWFKSALSDTIQKHFL